MAVLVDTNVLVYSFDARFPKKQERAIEILGAGLASDVVRIPHQAVIEFMSVVTRSYRQEPPILAPDIARREAEELLAQFTVLYPTEALVRTAIRGMATYQLSWFDAHLWAYAEHYGLEELWSEDFQHGRRYGTVSVVNPFV
ncbi:MAG TPA: PIN domain-containing protein [Polyangiaceae bacterium]|nr:PIN domain-containing protein [Polyangiaceae bacterium]